LLGCPITLILWKLPDSSLFIIVNSFFYFNCLIAILIRLIVFVFRNGQRLAHCVFSRINSETNSTCLVEDKVYIVNRFKALVPREFPGNVSYCKF
jgi:hypothetical protein